jgi:hypothetical protein
MTIELKDRPLSAPPAIGLARILLSLNKRCVPAVANKPNQAEHPPGPIPGEKQ